MMQLNIFAFLMMKKTNILSSLFKQANYNINSS